MPADWSNAVAAIANVFTAVGVIGAAFGFFWNEKRNRESQDESLRLIRVQYRAHTWVEVQKLASSINSALPLLAPVDVGRENFFVPATLASTVERNKFVGCFFLQTDILYAFWLGKDFGARSVSEDFDQALVWYARTVIPWIIRCHPTHAGVLNVLDGNDLYDAQFVDRIRPLLRKALSDSDATDWTQFEAIRI